MRWPPAVRCRSPAELCDIPTPRLDVPIRRGFSGQCPSSDPQGRRTFASPLWCCRQSVESHRIRQAPRGAAASESENGLGGAPYRAPSSVQSCSMSPRSTSPTGSSSVRTSSAESGVDMADSGFGFDASFGPGVGGEGWSSDSASIAAPERADGLPGGWRSSPRQRGFEIRHVRSRGCAPQATFGSVPMRELILDANVLVRSRGSPLDPISQK